VQLKAAANTKLKLSHLVSGYLAGIAGGGFSQILWFQQINLKEKNDTHFNGAVFFIVR
jgi:hypothetical protein